jgi:hypothetical protein
MTSFEPEALEQFLADAPVNERAGPADVVLLSIAAVAPVHRYPPQIIRRKRHQVSPMERRNHRKDLAGHRERISF